MSQKLNICYLIIKFLTFLLCINLTNKGICWNTFIQLVDDFIINKSEDLQCFLQHKHERHTRYKLSHIHYSIFLFRDGSQIISCLTMDYLRALLIKVSFCTFKNTDQMKLFFLLALPIWLNPG